MKRALPILSCLLILILIIAFGRDQKEPEPAIITIEHGSEGLFILKDRGSILRPPNYEIKKEDKTYVITYRGSKPKVLYLNERPLYITPGDKVHLDYGYIAEPGKGRDTLIAIGDNANNYLFSYLLSMYKSGERERKVNIFYPTLSDERYVDGTRSYFDDLAFYREVSGKYLDSILAVRGYNMDIRRQAELDNFVMNMYGNRITEDKLLRMGSIQQKDFSKKVEKFFESRDIGPQDTLLSPNIEGAISLYFGHLKNIKFERAETDEQFKGLYSYVYNYPNSFVREYLLYFLMKDEDSPVKEKYTVGINEELIKSKNKTILAELHQRSRN